MEKVIQKERRAEIKKRQLELTRELKQPTEDLKLPHLKVDSLPLQTVSMTSFGHHCIEHLIATFILGSANIEPDSRNEVAVYSVRGCFAVSPVYYQFL